MTSTAEPDENVADGPELSSSLLDDLARVLTGFGASARDAEQLVRSVAATNEPEAVADILLAKAPERAAWIASMDGYLHRVRSGCLLTEEKDAPAGGYGVDTGSRAFGGGVSCWPNERTAWQFRHLDGRVLRVPLGSRVEVGDLLNILGSAPAVAAVADRLAGLCALDREAAERVVRPLFDAVEILDDGIGGTWPGTWPDLPPGALCTIRRFRIEQGRAISRALRDLPSSADPRLHAVAAVRDDAERAEAFNAQRLHRVADDAGLSIDFVAGRRVHLGCADLAVLLDQGGAIPPGSWADPARPTRRAPASGELGRGHCAVAAAVTRKLSGRAVPPS